MNTRLSIWIFLVTLIFPCISLAQYSWNMELVGKAAYDGLLIDYAAYENHLYIITEKINPDRYLLTVVDISNPSHPHRAQAMYEGDIGPALITVDSLLYLVNQDGDTLIILSLADPAVPVEIERLSIGQYFENFEQLKEDILGCPQYYNYKLIDIQDSMNPRILVDLDLTYVAAEGQLMGDYLFISGYLIPWHYAYLEVFDIADTSNPVSVYYCRFEYNAYPRIQIIDHYLYYSYEPRGIRLFDIQDPSNPVLSDTIMTDYLTLDMQLLGNQIILMGGFDSLLTIDVTDPASPFLTGAYYNQGDSYKSQLVGGRLHIISNGDIISWFDVAEPQNPQLIGRYLPYSNTIDIAKFENYVYTSVARGGLRVFDVSNPADPVGIGYFATDYQSTKIRVFDDYLFLADNYAGVRIFSLADAPKPGLLSTVFSESNAHDMSYYDSLLYIANNDGFRIVNISDPANPAILGYYPTSHFNNNYNTIISNDSLVYTSESENGICIYNVSDPTNPIKIGCLDSLYHPTEFVLRNPLLYAAGYPDGMVIFDLSNPSQPVPISSTGPAAGAIYLHDNHSYLTSFEYLKAFDISDPYDPDYIAGYSEGGSVTGVVVENDTAYVSAGPKGMWIIRNEITTDLENNCPPLPQNSGLCCYPNPFNASTTIRYSLPEACYVTIEIFDILGRKIETLVDQNQRSGYYQVTWNAADKTSGSYFYKITAGYLKMAKKMVLIK